MLGVILYVKYDTSSCVRVCVRYVYTDRLIFKVSLKVPPYDL